MSSPTEQINQQFLCPITHEIMKDPVIGSDGQTYERSAITEWLKHNHVSPVTRQHMENKDLIPNHALRNTIEQFLQLQGIQQPATATAASSASKKPAPVYNHNIKLELDAVPIGNEEPLVHISAIPDDEVKRKPCVVICILDVSGSMQTEATENSKEGESGFSRLDLVKHSMNTVVNILDAQDHLAIVPFSTSARVQLPLTLMSEVGKKRAIKEIEGLDVDSQTNIWDGLRVAMDLTKNPICKDQNVVLLLLTDGEPNVDPPRGLVPTLKKYVAENPLACTIHTFGFGYQLDSQLLNDISNVGSGTYAYIPDCTMVGTVFVNFLSNALSMMANRAHLSITPATGVKIVDAVGFGGPNSDLELGSIQYGQSRDIILKVSVPKGHTGSVLMASLKYGDQETKSTLPTLDTKNETEVYYHYSRLLVVERVKKAMADFKLSATLEDCLKLIEQTMKEIGTFPSKQDTRVQALLADLKSSKEHEGGQVCKAFSKAEWYTKWGQHYIPSLLRAHSQQQCNNFKDPGVQIYGGKLFAELRERADSIFCKLPPPKPSTTAEAVARQFASFGYAVPQAAPARSQTTNMSAWYNSSGSCFTAEGIVSLDKNTTKRVADIRKGDFVKSGEATAEVVCVIKTKIANPTTRLVDLNGVRITPYHPVRVEGVWKFPQDIKEPTHQACDFVYNLVLDKMHIVTINGWECVTLGHGFNDNEVVSHAYFGTERVIQDLKKMQGWEAGFIELNEQDISRDQETGRVVSFHQ